MRRWIPTLSALSGAMAVVTGAFGAHAAVGEAREWLRTAAEYQMIHAVAALVALAFPRGRSAALLFVLGGFVFAATLDAMALGGPRWLGAVTPLGGLAMIAGWIVLAVGAFRSPD